MNRSKIFLLCLLCFMSFSCSTPQNPKPSVGSLLKQYTEQDGRACIRSLRIRGWSSLNDDVVAIDGGSRYYLATLMPGCLSMETSFAAKFSGDFGEVCGGGMDEVKLADETCRIRELFEFPDRATAQQMFTRAAEARRMSGKSDAQ